MAKNDLTPEILRALFDYDPSVGLLMRSESGWPGSPHTRAAGFVAKTGYRIVRVRGHQYMAHRLIWRHQTGAWPTGELDHINGDRDDNRLSNLRDVSSEENSQNNHSAQKNSTSGVLGVSPSGHLKNPWRAQIKVPGRSVLYLGLFPTVAEAEAAYISAKIKLHSGWIPMPNLRNGAASLGGAA